MDNKSTKRCNDNWHVWLSLLFLVGGTPLSADDNPVVNAGNLPALAGEVVRHVEANFFDASIASAWATRHREYATAVVDRAAFNLRTKAVLADLNVSHTAYFTQSEPEYYGLRSVFRHEVDGKLIEWDSAGLDVDGDGFVRAVFAGGPASTAGIKRGDRILTADEKPFKRVESFRGRAGRQVTLSLERTNDGPRMEVTVVPRRIAPRNEWMEAQKKGSRAIERAGRSVAFVPMYACAGDEYRDQLEESLASKPLVDCSALVIDFRGGWGGCNPSFVRLFDPRPAALTFVPRNGDKRLLDGQWRKPVYLLIDAGTRSGKEVVAYSIKRHQLGMLVGAKTAGAVLGGSCKLLSDGSLIYLATNDILVDGQRHEGRGVEPDVAVADQLQFANGADPQLEAALRLAFDR